MYGALSANTKEFAPSDLEALKSRQEEALAATELEALAASELQPQVQAQNEPEVRRVERSKVPHHIFIQDNAVWKLLPDFQTSIVDEDDDEWRHDDQYRSGDRPSKLFGFNDHPELRIDADEEILP